MDIDFSLLPREERVLVACSGGADSLALLLALREAEYSLVVAHVNHSLRGEESDADEAFVREVCEKLKTPFASARLDFSGRAPNEAELRDARYADLIQLAREYSCSRIVTGHTALDSLETVLLNLLRGSPVAGLCGIAPQRELATGLWLVRPMMNVTRESARRMLRDAGWSWREDSSNNDPQFFRNRLRSELLPPLFRLSNPMRLVQNMTRSGQILRDDIALLESLAAAEMTRLSLKREDDLLVLDAEGFRALPIALQRRVLRATAHTICDEARDVGFERVEKVRLHVLAYKRRAVWQWRKDLRVEWTGEHGGNRIRFLRV